MTLKTHLILTALLTSPAIARGSGEAVTSHPIDDLLNNPDRSISRTNQDFIGNIMIPGIPTSASQTVTNIVTVGNRSAFDSPSSDKSQYNLFNRTPDHLLRDLSPDRPDATESPFTVDAGRYQIEASLFDYRRDSGAETFTYGQINLKAGLTHNIDLQAVIDLRTEAAGDWTTFGDLTLRLKYNIWGNDGGDTALALMPYVTAPTRSAEWEGGIIIPWATQLTDDVSLGLQGQFDIVHDGDDYETQFLFTAVIGYPIIGNLGGYTEYIGIIAEDRYESYYSGGLTYQIDEDLILDTGVQIGLNSDSADFGLFSGFTKRF